ncbi:MAG: ABC transporter substrate-binding protein [Anaerolineales bacterium]
MLQKRFMAVLGLLVVASMILSACGPATTAATTAPGATSAPEATEVPEVVIPNPEGQGGYLDRIAFSVVDGDSAVSQISAGAIDMYSYGLASTSLPDILEAGLSYASFYGTYYDMMFNVAPFTDTTVLNPFTNRKIREAMNWLIDRDYINQEVYAGGALPKFTPLTTQLVDYTGVIDVARGLEAYYAYNPDKAAEVVAAELEAMGATMGADGKWQFNGAPLSLKFLIRNDGDGTRLAMGDYYTAQLESIGFTMDVQYGTGSELAALWQSGTPEVGEWNIYTAGWGSSGLNRDEGSSFNQMYASNSINGLALFFANTDMDPTFLETSDKLINGDYATLDERHDLFVEALPLALQDSLQVWLVDTLQFAPFNNNVSVTYDVGAGIEAARLPVYTLRFIDQEGGTMRIGTSDLFGDAWNPILGSNWIYDNFVQTATRSSAFMPDPFTGLFWPHHAASATLTMQTGLPVATNFDWVTLDFADTVAVPADAWGDWDSVSQTFIPVGEGVTAKGKIVVTYPDDLYETVKWHDGSNFSIADVVMSLITIWEPVNPESPIYDEAQALVAEALLGTLKGVRITSTDPLVIETYTDLLYPDAELIVGFGALGWPIYSGNGSGEAPWQVIAMGNAAEAAGQLAYSQDKADLGGVEMTNLVGGPSLEILSAQLADLAANSTIPYAPTMSMYLTADEAAARYANLQAWFDAQGHYWVGTGPYFLDQVDLVAKTAVVTNFADFADSSDRWADFSSPPLADVLVEGPAQVTIGDDAAFNVTVTTRGEGEAYPSADIKEVKFIVYNEAGETVFVGNAVAAGGDGLFTATIPADVTADLVAGSGRIEVAAVLIPVAIPAFSTADYVVAQ